MYENSDNLKLIVKSDISQGSVAARFLSGGLFSYHLTIHLLLNLAVNFFKLVNAWQS